MEFRLDYARAIMEAIGYVENALYFDNFSPALKVAYEMLQEALKKAVREGA